MAIQNNVIHHAYLNNVKRLLFLGSSCIYPKNALQPLKEEYLLTGPLEETNRPYALAKITGIEMCWSYNRQYGTKFLAAMPTNLFGPRDNYDLNNSHVLPALLRKFHLSKLASNGDWTAIENDEKANGKLPEDYRKELLGFSAKKIIPEVTVWGTGKPKREFMFSEDMADACIFLLKLPEIDYENLTAQNRNSGIAPVVNIGVASDMTIAELAEKIRTVTGFSGVIKFDTSKPDGTNQKLMNVDRLKQIGWKNSADFDQRLREVYEDYLTGSKISSDQN